MTLLLLSSCSHVNISWQSNGVVKFGHHHLSTQLQNAYAALITENGIYIVAKKIDIHSGEKIQTKNLSDNIETLDVCELFEY